MQFFLRCNLLVNQILKFNSGYKDVSSDWRCKSFLIDNTFLINPIQDIHEKSSSTSVLCAHCFHFSPEAHKGSLSADVDVQCNYSKSRVNPVYTLRSLSSHQSVLLLVSPWLCQILAGSTTSASLHYFFLTDAHATVSNGCHFVLERGVDTIFR